MTSNQLKLREVKELERHNLATEGLTAEMNQVTAEHYVRADRSSLIQAYAAQSQAAAAHRNAAVNEINAVTNRYNAETNRLAAEAQITYNSGMLEVAKTNAESQRYQANAALTNAETNQAKQALDESKFDWQQAMDLKNYDLNRYEANVKGLAVKEQAYEFSKTFPEQQKNWKSERVLNTAKTVNQYTGALKNFGQGVESLWKTGSDIIGTYNFYKK